MKRFAFPLPVWYGTIPIVCDGRENVMQNYTGKKRPFYAALSGGMLTMIPPVKRFAPLIPDCVKGWSSIF